MKLLKEEVYTQVKEDLATAQSEVADTEEYQKQIAADMAKVSDKIQQLNKEHEKLTQESNRLKNAQIEYNNVLQDLRFHISNYEKKLREHEWEESVRKYITEYDSFYTFLEREIDKEQKRLLEVSPQQIEFTAPATAAEKYKAMVEGGGISQGLIDMRSFVSHYDNAIRDMAETRANNRKVSIEQLRVPLQIVSRCVASRTTTSLWYS